MKYYLARDQEGTVVQINLIKTQLSDHRLMDCFLGLLQEMEGKQTVTESK